MSSIEISIAKISIIMGYKSIDISKKRLERAKKLKPLVTRKTLTLKQALTIYAEEVGISFPRAQLDYYEIIKPTLKR